MPRFFLDNAAGDTAEITGADARHIACSLRMLPGERLVLCDGSGCDCDCVIESASPERVALRVEGRRRCPAEPPAVISLYQCLPKGDKMELITQKAVELGASRIIPVLSARCVSRPDERAAAKKLERLQKIAAEAAKQSGRGIIPAVEPLIRLPQAAASMRSDAAALFFYELGGISPERALGERPKSVSLLVGPEGGFDADEAELLTGSGIPAVTLGPRILRCETAPLAALAILTHLLETEAGAMAASAL